jgi:hypothetical protein
VWLGVQTVDGGATSFALSSAGARSLAGAAVGIPALALSTAAGWIGWQTDEGRFADETSAFAVAGALFVTAGFLLTLGIYPWLAAVYRQGRAKGYTSRTLGIPNSCPDPSSRDARAGCPRRDGVPTG